MFPTTFAAKPARRSTQKLPITSGLRARFRRGRESISDALTKVRDAVAARIKLKLAADRTNPPSTSHGQSDYPHFTAEKLVIESEPGIRLPALLLRPKSDAAAKTVVLHLSDLGKPSDPAKPTLALEMVGKGYTVLSLDVRGAGETDSRDHAALKPIKSFDPQEYQYETTAIDCVRCGSTLLAMQTFDVVRAMDWLAGRDDLSSKRLVLAGEGLGGAWALTAAAFDSRPAGVITVGMVPSYKLIVGSQYYAARDYFWVPGALKDFDLPDLVALAAPRPVLMIDSVDAMLAPLSEEACRAACAWPLDVYKVAGVPERLRLVHTAEQKLAEVTAAVVDGLDVR